MHSRIAHGLRTGLAAATLCTLAAPLAAQTQLGTQPGDVGSIQTGDQLVRFRIDGTGAANRYRTVEIVEIRDQRGTRNASFDLSESPLWRLDFRKLDKLGTGNPSHNAAWKLVPSLDPLDNLPLPGGSHQAWIDATHAASPSVLWRIPDVSTPYAQLIWRNVPLEFWPYNLTGFVDVIVHIRLDPNGNQPIHLSIDVETKLDDNADINGAILSVGFPELMLGALEFDTLEPAASDAFDDYLLVPWTHGYIVPDPINVLEVDPALNPTTVGWIEDSNAIDFEPGRARNLTYPGDTSTQFMFYYDVDTQEPYIQLDGDTIEGYGQRPSLRGGGPGMYMAAHDPDMNVKRIIHEGRDGWLRMAIRTFVAFDWRENRLQSLKNVPAAGNARQTWQRYCQGVDSSATTAPGDDLHFEWSVVLYAFEGDWLHATERYKSWFDRISNALWRDDDPASTDPVRLRNYPNKLLPAAYKNLVAVIGLNEATATTTPGGEPIGGTPGGYLTAFQNLEAYVNFLREDFEDYQNTNKFPDPPHYAVIHSNGMTDEAGAPVKSAGNDVRNNSPRPGLADLFAKARRDIGYMIIGQNRDTGTWKEKFAPVNGNIAARTETGALAFRTDNGGVDNAYLLGYDRWNGPGNLWYLLGRSLDGFVPSVESTPDIPVDWYWISGRGSAAIPDYSMWFENPHGDMGEWAGAISTPSNRFGDPNTVGGGSAWADYYRALLRHLRVNKVRVHNGAGLQPSVRLLTSTERLAEHLLLGTIPSGHRKVYLNRWFPNITNSQDKHMQLFGESVGLTSFLFHDFTILRGEPHTFAQYYGLPMDDPGGACPNPGSTPPPGYFDQSQPAERQLGERFNYQMLAHEVVYLGLLPVVSVELIQNDGPDGWPLVCDSGAPGLDSLDDRLSTAGFEGITVGKYDLATGYTDADEAPAFLRKMFRARSQFREFFIGGRRVRDPQVVNPTPGSNPWFADDMQVFRWGSILMGVGDPDPIRFTGDESKTGPMPPLSTERLVVGSYMNFIPSQDLGNRQFRILVCVCNPSDQAVDYALQFIPADWPLPPQGLYKLRKVNLDLNNPPAATGIFPSDQATPVTSSNTTIDSRDLHYWVIEIEDETVPPTTP